MAIVFQWPSNHFTTQMEKDTSCETKFTKVHILIRMREWSNTLARNEITSSKTKVHTVSMLLNESSINSILECVYSKDFHSRSIRLC
jgi:hypothetical protein